MELMKSDNTIQVDRPEQHQPQQQQKQQQEMMQKQQQEQQEQQQQRQQEHHFHVLAVDDNTIDRKLLEKLLKVSSYQVTCVDSGDKALEYLGLLDNLDSHHSSKPSPCSSSPPSSSSSSSLSSSSSSQSSQQEGLKVNLIMTDFCMPGMTGYDLLKRVKGSSWKDVPVVVMSSENVPSRISMCLEGGAEEFMLKPLRLSDLDKIQAYLLKSLHHSCTHINNDLVHCDNDEGEDEGDDYSYTDDNGNNNNDNGNGNNINNNNNNNNNSFSKRKAISSEATDQRRPKMKGLATVLV